MKIFFRAVGKAHETYVKMGVEDFTRRINNYFKTEWEILPSPKDAANFHPAELKKKEAMIVLSKIQKDDFLVVLEERGRQITSVELSDFLQLQANNGTRKLVFLIGGAYGSDATVLERADMQWSLSKLVFPHQLVRLILAEQVYRACTILRNEKYHHS